MLGKIYHKSSSVNQFDLVFTFCVFGKGLVADFRAPELDQLKFISFIFGFSCVATCQSLRLVGYNNLVEVYSRTMRILFC